MKCSYILFLPNSRLTAVPCGDVAGLLRGGAGTQPAGLRLQPAGREGVQHGPVHPAAG